MNDAHTVHDVANDLPKISDAKTVHDVTYDLLRSLGLTTVFGNPGSAEQTFLQRFTSRPSLWRPTLARAFGPRTSARKRATAGRTIKGGFIHATLYCDNADWSAQRRG